MERALQAGAAENPSLESETAAGGGWLGALRGDDADERTARTRDVAAAAEGGDTGERGAELRVVLVDDNMYYRSMRHRVFVLARDRTSSRACVREEVPC